MKKFLIIFIFLFYFPNMIGAHIPPCPPAVNCPPSCENLYCCQPPDAECEGGLVPCGRTCDDPRTENICECHPCSPCHLFVLFKRVIDFLFKDIIFPLAVLMIVIGGFLFLTSGGDVEKLKKGKEILFTTLIGLLIIFSAWLIINLFILFITGQEIKGIGTIFGTPWNEMSCSPPEASAPPLPCGSPGPVKAK